MVDIAGQAANIGRNLRYRGLGAVHEAASMVRYSLWSRTAADPVLAADWDALVVLDACRADLFRAVVVDGDGEVPPGEFETRTSPASASKEWLEAVFGTADDDRLADLAYVTGNPYSSGLETERFHTLEEVWLEAWDDDAGTIPAGPVTDAAIRTGRERNPDRLVVHYMQPHFPSLGDTQTRRESERGGVTLEQFGESGMSVWEDLRLGRRTVEDARAAYRANLRYVLDEVAVLLANLDAERVVLTADHGNAFGEHAIYGHPGGVDLPCLREVPWYETTATDTHSRETVSRDQTATVDDDTDEGEIVDQRLEDLGYKP